MAGNARQQRSTPNDRVATPGRPTPRAAPLHRIVVRNRTSRAPLAEHRSRSMHSRLAREPRISPPHEGNLAHEPPPATSAGPQPPQDRSAIAPAVLARSSSKTAASWRSSTSTAWPTSSTRSRRRHAALGHPAGQRHAGRQHHQPDRRRHLQDHPARHAGETDNAAGEFAILPTGGNLTIVNTSGGTVTVDGNGQDRVFDINPDFDPATHAQVHRHAARASPSRTAAPRAANPDGPTAAAAASATRATPA